MKTYNEMANSALQKIEAQTELKKNKRKRITRIAVPFMSFCLVALFGIGFGNIHQNAPATPDSVNSTIYTNTSESEKQDIISINQIESISARKIAADLSEKDFTAMSANELKDYYGTNIFPTVPKDLEADNAGGYGIYRKGNGTVYWDQNILNYFDKSFTRSVNIEIAKDKLPVMDFGVGDENAKMSMISGTEVYLGCTESGYYQASFIFNKTGFVLTTSGLSQAEVISVIKSLVN